MHDNVCGQMQPDACSTIDTNHDAISQLANLKHYKACKEHAVFTTQKGLRWHKLLAQSHPPFAVAKHPRC